MEDLQTKLYGEGAPAVEKTLPERLAAVLGEALESFKNQQREDGHWVFELEADVTIPADYIMLNHFLNMTQPKLEAELAEYIRGTQNVEGGWPLFYRGETNISASVKAYYALKLAGDSPTMPHMKRARKAILAAGGAEASNVFTRYALAIFGQVPWRAVPVMPVELMLMPKWFPVNVWRFSYWSRTVIAPLLLLASLKAEAKNPQGIGIAEIFKTPPFEIENYHVRRSGSRWEGFFFALDRLLRRLEPHFPKRLRRRAINRSVSFITERLNGQDGLGGIFPAMANSAMAFRALGYDADHPDFKTALNAARRLISWESKPRFIQPCWSPIWDTGLGALALLEAGEAADSDVMGPALSWMKSRQILDFEGDWAAKRPGLRPGGWAFQYQNDHYPDVDDTAVVAMALHRARPERYKEAVARAGEWIVGMQCKNGGWASFDAENSDSYLNHIPFADHGALLDPPTEDVTARCLGFLSQFGYATDHPVIRKGRNFLLARQQDDGSWFGRWGTNYIYGTWSVLAGLNALEEDPEAPHIRRAVDWLLSCQRPDGGWGEDGASYWQERRGEAKASTPSQTAWALLGLMAAGEVHHRAVEQGIDYLCRARRNGDKWREPWYTAVGFPRVFYLRYDGYSRYFPIWALARYQNLSSGNSGKTVWGM